MKCPLLVLGWVAALCCFLAVPAFCLPPGRSWAPTVPLTVPGVALAVGPRMEVEAEGIPMLIMEARSIDSAILTWNAFTWRDSAWANSISSDIPGFDIPEFSLSLTPRRYLTWLSPPDLYGYSRMLISEVLAKEILPPDTAMFTLDQDTEFSGAASARRRWVVRSQARFPVSVALAIRTVYSDTSKIWHELPELGVDEDHCTMAPLSDTSAIVVYAGESGLGFGVVEGSRWTHQGNLDPRPLGPAHPRFRFRPSGGLWLLWTERRWVHVSGYRNGKWERGDSLKCEHADGLFYSSAWTDLTHDEAERPVLAWGIWGCAMSAAWRFPPTRAGRAGKRSRAPRTCS